MENVNVKVDGNTKVLVLREGDALPLQEPVQILIAGLIDSPFKYLEKRVEKIKQEKAHIIIDVDDRKIKLICDESNHYRTEVLGGLRLDKDFVSFGINTGEAYSTFELADFIKMHRFCFEKPSIAMELVSVLRKFKAKVDKDIENADDQRGNKNQLLVQTIESNIPKSFKLVVPIFSGQEKKSFEVEININDRFECSLISPEANDIVNGVGETALNEQIGAIKEIAPNIVILSK